jgi:hypothetical protein
VRRYWGGVGVEGGLELHCMLYGVNSRLLSRIIIDLTSMNCVTYDSAVYDEQCLCSRKFRKAM